MNHSESIKELATALAKAQGMITHAAKDSSNPYFSSKYADLASVWEAIRKPLSDNGLSVAQFPETTDSGAIAVTTMVLHSSGEWLSGTVSVVPKDATNPQVAGSVITYLRRYALQSAVGIAPDDDDGNAAAGNTAQGDAQKKTAPKKEMQRVADEAKEAGALAPKKDLGFLQMVGKEKTRVGEAKYYEILGMMGYKHADELTANMDKINFNKALKAAPDYVAPTREPGEEG